MKLKFERLMAQALQLTQSGRLMDATSAIQSALRSGEDPARRGAPDPMVIEMPSAIIEPRERAHAAGQFITGQHTSKGQGRSYKLYIPPAADQQPRPLVVMLHGCTQDADDFAAGTRMNEAAQQQGLYVLYPEQAQGANPSRCWNWFKHTHQRRDRGEPALLASMVLEISRQHAIDRSRIYVAGLSAGGAMAAILGDTHPELFAAVGVHSGLPAGAATDLASAYAAMQGQGAAPIAGVPARPTIVFHGDQDSTVHPVNGQRAVRAQALASAPDSSRLRSGNGRDYTQHVYRDAAGRPVAEHWVVHGSGHAWSGGSAQGSYTDPKGPDATREMLRFFLSHRLT